MTAFIAQQLVFGLVVAVTLGGLTYLAVRDEL